MKHRSSRRRGSRSNKRKGNKRKRSSGRNRSNKRYRKNSRRQHSRRSTSDLMRRLQALDSKRKMMKFSSPRPQRAKKNQNRKYVFPDIPKTSLPKSSQKKQHNCCAKILAMRRKYKQGQKLIDDVDKFMGKTDGRGFTD